jgi:monomeric isocitrate dehydrogenase
MTQKSRLFTLTDEAPLLATVLLPIVKHLLQQQVLKWKQDISLWQFYLTLSFFK